MKQLINKIKIISIFFIAIAFQGCVEDQVEFPTAFAEFTYTVNQETGVVKFINTSRNASIYTWTFGDTQSSNEINPTHIYAPGTYTVTLVAKNIAGSFRTFQDIIVIGDPNSNTGGGGGGACTAEDAENINPANGDINWTFKTNDIAHTFAAFGNTGGSIVANPVPDAVNSSCNVEEFVKTNGCETWSGLGSELGTALNFASATTKKVFKMKVLAKNQVANVTLRLERLPHPNTDPAVEKVASITKVGEWQEVTFDFSDVTTGTYKSMIIYFERNATCDGDIYYFDDIKQVAGGAGGGGGTGGGACTAETAQSLASADFNLTFQTDPTASIIQDNATFAYVNNPDFSTTDNNSCKVGKVTKSNVQAWDNIQINFANKFVFTSGSNFTIKVFSPQAGYKVTLKLEDKTNGATNSGDIPSSTSTTKTNGWETLTIPIPVTHTGKYDKLVIFFDLSKASTNTYYFDDLKLNAGTGGSGGGGGGSSTAYSLDKPIDFETTGYGANWIWNVYENVDNPPIEFVANPSTTGNTSAKVAKLTIRDSDKKWVGTETKHGEMGLTWDLSASNAVIKMWVYKSVISGIGIKLVTPTGGAQGPIIVSNTKINQWEQLTFDFSARVGVILDGNQNIDQIAIHADIRDGAKGGEAIMYFDNITFGSN